MHNRTAALYHSMCRIADVVARDEVLRARAGESTAIDHFNVVIREFEALAHHQATAALEIQALRAERRAAAVEACYALECVHATAALIRTGDAKHLSFRPPLTSLGAYRFSVAARALINAAEEHADAFIDAGLNPQTFAQARDALARLETADRNCAMAEVYAAARPKRTECLVANARLRIRQLFLELAPVMSAGVRAEWRRAAALGRSHRPNALGAGDVMKRIAASSASDAPASEVRDADNGIRGVARRVLLRIAGGVATETPAELETRATIEPVVGLDDRASAGA